MRTNQWYLTTERDVALPRLVKVSTKIARTQKLREKCMVDIGQRGVDLDEDCGWRERVVLGRGEGGYGSFVRRRREMSRIPE